MKFIHNSFSFHYFFSVTSMWIIHGMAVYSARSAAPILQERKSEQKYKKARIFLQFRLFGQRVNVPILFCGQMFCVVFCCCCRCYQPFSITFFYHHHNTYIQKLHFPFHSIPFEHLSYSFIHSSNVVLQQNLL